MTIAVIGTLYLEKYEEAAIVIVLYNFAEKLEDLGIHMRTRGEVEDKHDCSPTVDQTVLLKNLLFHFLAFMVIRAIGYQETDHLIALNR